MEVVERDERDMEEVGAARRIVARQRGDLRLHLRRRLGHDVEGVSGAHGGSVARCGGRPTGSDAMRRRSGSSVNYHRYPRPTHEMKFCKLFVKNPQKG